MSRPSPQTTRVVDTVDLLTGHLADGGDGLTLSEISRALPANASSCVHLLAALMASGWVVRDPETLRYRVGPALVAPGRQAQERHGELVVLHAEMKDLAEDVGYPVLAFRRLGRGGVDDGDDGRSADELARLELMVRPRHRPVLPLRVGDTVPIVAPLGPLYVAWSSEREIQRWLSSMSSPAHRERLAEDLALIRDAGYAVERDLQEVSDPELVAAVDERPSPYRNRQLYGILAGAEGTPRMLTDLSVGSPDQAHVVHGITAPVWRDGVVVAGLYVVGFSEPLGTSEIVALGRAVKEAAGRVSAAPAA